MKATKKRKAKLVRITWRNPNDDWHWFWLLEEYGDSLYLQGADDPEDGSKHDGDCFWAYRFEILRIEEMGQNEI